MQPIHVAARNGKTDVINMLVKKYGVDPQAKAAYVRVLYVYVYVPMYTYCNLDYVSESLNWLYTYIMCIHTYVCINMCIRD